MLEKRYQVFVSSTFRDLIDERQEITQALLELDCIPSGMELFPAANDDQWTLIKKVINDCDYYLVIIAGKYGSLGPDGTSYTEMEYRYALRSAKPIIAFLHKDLNRLTADRIETDPDARRKLDEFRALAQKKLVRFWDSPAELGSVVSRSLVQLIKSNPAVGWVRGSVVTDETSAQEILRLRKIIDKLENDKKERALVGPEDTKDLSQGDDTIEIDCRLTYRADGSGPIRSLIWISTSSWNDIFAALSPSMIDEANEQTIRDRLEKALQGWNYTEIKADNDLKNAVIVSFSIVVSSFETCLVQLTALGLIVKSNRNRSLKDKQTYWKLTEYGESVMYKLRAIRKSKS